jgi:hypothetical protein
MHGEACDAHVAVDKDGRNIGIVEQLDQIGIE